MSVIGPVEQAATLGAVLDVLCPMHLVPHKTGHVVHALPLIHI